jgi:hypothetical protein
MSSTPHTLKAKTALAAVRADKMLAKLAEA